MKYNPPVNVLLDMFRIATPCEIDTDTMNIISDRYSYYTSIVDIATKLDSQDDLIALLKHTKMVPKLAKKIPFLEIIKNITEPTEEFQMELFEFLNSGCDDYKIPKLDDKYSTLQNLVNLAGL
jgi:hypothetical protein